MLTSLAKEATDAHKMIEDNDHPKSDEASDGDKRNTTLQGIPFDIGQKYIFDSMLSSEAKMCLFLKMLCYILIFQFS